MSRGLTGVCLLPAYTMLEAHHDRAFYHTRAIPVLHGGPVWAADPASLESPPHWSSMVHEDTPVSLPMRRV